MSSWVRIHFEHLKKWREYAEGVARAVKDIVPSARVYVIGSVVSGTTTVYSDIDVLIVVGGVDEQAKRRLRVEILGKAIDDYGLPWDAPVELHIVDEVEALEYLKLSRAQEITL